MLEFSAVRMCPCFGGGESYHDKERCPNKELINQTRVRDRNLNELVGSIVIKVRASVDAHNLLTTRPR